MASVCGYCNTPPTTRGFDALDGLPIPSILLQFFRDADQSDALAAIRVWTAGLFDALDQQDALIGSEALGQLRSRFRSFLAKRIAI